LLSKQDFQLEVVDIIAKDEKELNAYSDTYDKYIDTKVRLNNLQSNVAQSEKEADFMKFQYEELSEAKLVKDEQEDLEEMSERMTHSEDIKQALYESESCFSRDENSILNDLKRSVSALRSVERVYGDVRELADRIESCYIELKDVDSEISQQLETIDFDPAELERINLRLDTIYSLQKKYHVSTVEELLAIQNDLKQKLEQIENSDEAIAELQREQETLSAECEQRADILTKKRQQAAKLIEKILLEKLVPLGMPHVRFNIEIEKEPLNRRGQDKVSFLFSANTSTPLQPVSQVASGGEIARVMLAIKAMISGFVKLPTIIFDEIDTGVSGKIAEQMAQIMHEMGMQERQVISITHLPQIASRGMNHYRVYKEETAQGTLSHMVELSKDERVNEIAQMLSGSSVSEAAIENARQLLNM
jgi:DNA repair protein RecN (Recombination protein N)